ncbi:MAG: hypothetical protein UT42_C0048G0005 [Candidatus Falkowbacteria bacterium GW2011_GWA2_39_24]|uniref:Cell envelope-related transcriptional attenuator domain-containing protein n=1 Tax=Candidatus Falkowbacteria bacterium GW2011_GWA2_39_24 TaxID=1618634 RepID=A0A0G0NKH0_9BACT|nr:MAG: hypothetical protein UT42_C0048G0005 [Candidatus Falkowbacteria bacterium GW2011_GWA2_39_24]
MENHDKLLRELEILERAKKANLRPKRSSFLKKLKRLTIALIVLVLVLFVFFYINGDGQDDPLSWINRIPVISQIKRLAESSNAPLAGEDRGRINVLILGMGGKNHEGAYLTDTIIVASFNLETDQVAMLSLPRDMIVPVQGMGWPKINHVYTYAELKEPGSGGRVTSEVIGQVLGAPIDYYLSVDFTGFVKIIDKLGGVDIYIDNAFNDYHYPILGEEDNPNWDARFEQLHFDQGWQEMNGDLALKYSRSRYASGVEGNDFARAARQQKVIMAIKDKMLSKSTLFNPKLVSSLVNEARENIHSNMKIGEMVRMWGLFKTIKQENIINKVLSNRPSGLLIDSQSADGAYTLVPRSGDFSEVKHLFDTMFYQIPDEDKQSVTAEMAKLQILNGTFTAGLANKTAAVLEKYGFNIINIANCSHQDFQTSVVYDLSFGEKKESLQILLEQIEANVAPSLPDWLKADIKKDIAEGRITAQPDMILILGTNIDQMPISTEDVDI